MTDVYGYPIKGKVPLTEYKQRTKHWVKAIYILALI